MLALRKATKTDLDFLIELRRQTMRPHFEKSGREYDEESQRQRLLYKYDCAEVVLCEGCDIGLLKVDRSQRPWTLIQIQVVAKFQRRGFGGQLVRRVLSSAAAQGAAVQLSVLKTNPAKRLYERLGFVVVEEKERAFAMLCTAASARQQL